MSTTGCEHPPPLPPKKKRSNRQDNTQHFLLPIHGLGAGVSGGNSSMKGFSFMAPQTHSFLFEEVFYSPLNTTAMLAQHEYPYIKNHVTLVLHKLRKPKSDCIQLWVVGDTLMVFQFQSCD